ncbi:hypothetical protein QBC40DRAFT_256125 [Triangularia verruculosa]|uniref:Uncharacterized protein n=1 Tax=Triangularia verruculosa TaxID=2587418 RepID=A0AAN6XE04_9PEZI|nr:hypothetical protein QBC40DRAFT_256125 [Triangularia verruculosa]
MGNPDDDDINISNGTCYYAPGKKAHEQFIPCGNVDFGNNMCCWAGSFCLGPGNICQMPDEGAVYMAGCTDSTYEDPSCPDKKVYSDQPWTDMVICKFDDINVLVGCEETGHAIVPQMDMGCVCTAAASPAIESRILFQGSQLLNNFASLPMATGESIKWVGTFTPTGTRTNARAPVKPPLPQELPAGSGRLGTPAVIGIVFGILVGLVLIMGALFAFRTLRNRKKTDDSAPGPEQMNDAAGAKGDGVPELASSTFPVLAELQTDNKARPEALRSELAAKSPTSPRSSYLSGAPDQEMRRPAMHPEGQQHDAVELPS